jgi:tape measure domain-containing protein
LASDAEQSTVAFTSMLKSEEKALHLLKELQTFAAATPFEFPQLKTAAKSLLTAGFAAQDIIPMMKTIGDTTSAMGTGAEGVERATYALMQMKNTGKITGGDMNQLNNAGIPAMKVLAAAMGKTVQQATAMSMAGQLGAKHMELFFNALKQGKGLEQYMGGMEQQAKTLAGLFSTLKDNIGIALTDVGTEIIRALKLKDLIQYASTVIGEYTGVFISGFKSLIAYLEPIAQKIGAFLSADGGLTAGIASLTIAFQILIGPIVAVAGFLATMFGPVTIGIIAISRLIAMWVESMGGLAGAWKALSPIVMQGLSLIQSAIQAVWTVGSFIFNQLWDLVKWVWSSVSDDTAITFKDIAMTIVSLMIQAEFAFRNIGRYAELAFDSVLYSAIVAFEEIVHFFTVTIPAIGSWFAEEWVNIFVTIGTNTVQVFQNLGDNIIMVMTEVWKSISSGGTHAMNLMWIDMSRGLINTIKTLPDIPDRVIGAMEANLADQITELQASLSADFEAFHETKMAELFPDEAKNTLDNTKKTFGGYGDPAQAAIGGIGKEVKDAFSAALVNTKEAFLHIEEYKKGLAGTSNNPQVAALVEHQKANETAKVTAKGVTDLVDIAQKQFNKALLNVRSANLGGF